MDLVTDPANAPIPESKYVLHRRFDRMGRLVGDASMEKLFRAHVMIVGVGGVGSMAAESLARSGVGRISLVDFDEICITNTNRQLHTLQGLIGRKKSGVMAERLRKINPQATIEDIPEFMSAETSERILSVRPDFVVDAIDNLTAKAHLIVTCRALGLPLISSMGAGSRMDPLAARVVDLSETHTDPMAHQLRKMLRSKHGFPTDGAWGIPAVFSEEVPRDPVELHYDLGQGFKCVCPQGQNDRHSCDRRNVIHGTASFVTAQFGLLQAASVVQAIVGDPKNPWRKGISAC
ncbi:MAG: tRNA threonylcarbamoyladenosine dehydratase [Bdellovibrionaceae bacterium]|nr:tRNA threonylcarbamoyladenosine dehydratase [Pseudobdellovibrionaceae bacterium]